MTINHWENKLNKRIMIFFEYLPCNWRFFLPNISMNPGGNLNVSPEEVVALVFIEVSDGQMHAVVSNPAVFFPGTVEKKYLSHDCIWFQ